MRVFHADVVAAVDIILEPFKVGEDSNRCRSSRANSLHNFDGLSCCNFNWKKAAWPAWLVRQGHSLGASRSDSQLPVADSSGSSAG